MNLRPGLDSDTTDDDFTEKLGNSRISHRRRFFAIAIILLLIALGLKTTLAANIGLGGGQIEFGRGILQAQACSPTATVTPIASYQNFDSKQRTNSLIYAWTGDGLISGGPDFNGLGYSVMDGVAGVANYVIIRVAEHVGNQQPGVADPGNTPDTRGGLLTIQGGIVSQSQHGIINSPGNSVLFDGTDSASEVRILTPTAGTIVAQLYKYLGGGLYATTASETIVITVRTSGTGNIETSSPWRFSSVKVAGLDPRCFGKEFTISAFESNQSTPLETYVYSRDQSLPADIGNRVHVLFDSSTATLPIGYNGYTVTRLSNSEFKVDFTVPSASSYLVSRLTLETSKAE